MTITADYHLHSSISGDSDAPMEDMILKGISLGLTHMCFTEHNDFDYPQSPDYPPDMFLLDTAAYRQDFLECRRRFKDRIHLCFGVELGLQPHLAQLNAAFAKRGDFDFIIASSHICKHQDPYYPAFYEGRSEEAAYRAYFSSILDNIRVYHDFDVYGHLDYVVRYGPNRDRDYCYDKYKNILDPILKLLIEKGKGIEINTGGLKNGLLSPHPYPEVVKRYRELGGEIVTVGSDAHEPQYIGKAFSLVRELLKNCGFRYYTIFKARTPEFIPL